MDFNLVTDLPLDHVTIMWQSSCDNNGDTRDTHARIINGADCTVRNMVTPGDTWLKTEANKQTHFKF